MRSVRADAVLELMRHVAAEEILPRFRALEAHEIHGKATEWDPNDVVTAADHAVERRLTAALRGILPGAPVVGEEAVAAEPALRNVLEQAGPAWIVDPLDGTRNFVEGRDTFGVIVALCHSGVVTQAWIHLPLSGASFVAEAGSGAFELSAAGGERRLRPGGPPESPLHGTIYPRFLDAGQRAAVIAHAPSHARLTEGTGSACTEYAFLLRAAKDFLLYGRLLPWDHAAGSLLLREAGGAMRLMDGSEYEAATRALGCVAVRDAALWEGARRSVTV